MYCIQETDKPNLLYRIFNHVVLENNKIIIPIAEIEKIGYSRAETLVKKVKKILDKTMCKRVIISKYIKKQEIFVNLLHTLEGIEIIDGRWLFESLSLKVLDYLINKNKLEKDKIRISIMVNDLSEYMLEIIKIISNEYKRVNIITNHIEKFKKIEKQLLEEDGNMITVGNNKKKGISKSNIILNVDFPTELINKYNIYEKAYIINIRENVKIERKRFEGVSINKYEISYKDMKEVDFDLLERFKISEIYEAQLNKRQPFKDFEKQIKKDEVKITKLITNHNIL